MEPRQNAPNLMPRQESTLPIATPESLLGGSLEQAPERLEKMPPAVEAAPVAPPTIPVLPAPLPAVSDGGDASAASLPTAVPLAASDDDLIEKEWVDHAKKIIEQTKDDPYQREREVSKLQIDYIRKRYGREIGENDD